MMFFRACLSFIVAFVLSIACVAQNYPISPWYSFSSNTLVSFEDVIEDIECVNSSFFPNSATGYRIGVQWDSMFITVPVVEFKVLKSSQWKNAALFGPNNNKVMVCKVATGNMGVLNRPDPFLPGSHVNGAPQQPTYQGLAWQLETLSPYAETEDYIKYRTTVRELELGFGTNAPYNDANWDCSNPFYQDYRGSSHINVLIGIWIDAHDADNDPLHRIIGGQSVEQSPILSHEFVPIDPAAIDRPSSPADFVAWKTKWISYPGLVSIGSWGNDPWWWGL